jgi:hypothetical protein
MSSSTSEPPAKYTYAPKETVDSTLTALGLFPDKVRDVGRKVDALIEARTRPRSPVDKFKDKFNKEAKAAAREKEKDQLYWEITHLNQERHYLLASITACFSHEAVSDHWKSFGRAPPPPHNKPDLFRDATRARLKKPGDDIEKIWAKYYEFLGKIEGDEEET